MRLHTRLLISYIVVLAVTLTVIGIALLLFLNTRPAPPQNTYRQLSASAQASLRSIVNDVRGGPLVNRLSETQLVDELSAFSSETGVRTLLFLGEEERLVWFDSSEVYDRGDLPELRIDPSVEPGIEFGGPLRNRLGTESGTLIDPDGIDWLYLSLVISPPQRESAAVVYALPQPTQTVREALTDFGSALGAPLLQAAFMGLVIAVFSAILVSRTIVRPLLHIADAARAVAEGNYDQQVPVTGPPEVRTLAEAFNHMTQQVQAARQTQQDFMVNVSHDLKTPLTSIQGYSQAIMDGTSPNAVESARVIHEEAERLNRMVVEITDLARLQDGQMRLKLHPMDLNPMVKAVGERLAIMAQKKNIDLRVEAEQTLPKVNGDGDRLAQVVTNLLSNAIKYTPRGGQVRLLTRQGDGGVEIVVQDNGSGIPAADLPRIFERFYQVDKTRGPRRGTGLGLAITREIIQAHGGTIDAYSAGADLGATFTVWLPADQKT